MIHLGGVRKAFGSQVVLESVDFDVAEGLFEGSGIGLARGEGKKGEREVHDQA